MNKLDRNKSDYNNHNASESQAKKDTGIMTWITMTTRIWLKKGFVRNLMKLQNIIETRIFTVHCLIKKIGIARQLVPENKISLQIIR